MKRISKHHRVRPPLFLSAWIFFVLSPPLHGDSSDPLLFGVFPYLPPARLEQIYAPLAADLSEAAGRRVQLRTRPSFEQFREELERETYDLIFIQPVAYVETAQPNGYRTIALSGEPLKALFVVRKDNDIQTLHELSGQTVANPPINAAVSLLGKKALLEQQLIPGNDLLLSYQNSHAACLRQVLIRKAAACVTAAAPLKIFQERSGIDFRILASSRSIPGSTYAVHRRLPESITSALEIRIMGWSNSSRGRQLLNNIKLPGFVKSRDVDYDPVRDILEQVREASDQ